MGKMGLAGTSLVSAVPGGALFALLLLGLLNNFGSMPMMIQLVVVMGLLISFMMAAFPVYALVGVKGLPKAERPPKVKKEKLVKEKPVKAGKEKPVKEKKSLFGRKKSSTAGEAIVPAAAAAASGIDIGMVDGETNQLDPSNPSFVDQSDDWGEVDNSSETVALDEHHELPTFDDEPESSTNWDDDTHFQPSEDFEEAASELQSTSNRDEFESEVSVGETQESEDDLDLTDYFESEAPEAEVQNSYSVEQSNDDDFMSELGIEEEPELEIDSEFEDEERGTLQISDYQSETSSPSLDDDDDFLAELGLDDDEVAADEEFAGDDLGAALMEVEEEDAFSTIENSGSDVDDEFEFEFFDDEENEENKNK